MLAISPRPPTPPGGGARRDSPCPFFTTRDVGRGTGQGLAIARAIVVEQHGGSPTFETALGRGTTFAVRLPIEGLEGGEAA